MSAARPGGPVPDLGQAGRFAVLEWDLVPANAVELKPGAVGAEQSTHHLRVLDFTKARAIIVPMEPKQLQALYETLQGIPEANASVTTQPGPDTGQKGVSQ